MIDDATAKYGRDVQPYFEDLKQCASQLAGLLVLAAAGANSAGPEHPMLVSAEQAYRRGADGIRSVAVSQRAREHHGHLLRAIDLIELALTDARQNKRAEEILKPLRAGYSDLQAASNKLPGFEIISFERACCAGAIA